MRKETGSVTPQSLVNLGKAGWVLQDILGATKSDCKPHNTLKTILLEEAQTQVAQEMLPFPHWPDLCRIFEPAQPEERANSVKREGMYEELIEALRSERKSPIFQSCVFLVQGSVL